MSSSIVIGKIIALILKIFSSRGGTALPGLIALKLNPSLINQIIKKNQLFSIIITGTNGKTTTCRLLGNILKTSGLNYIHNRSGSNLLRGIASTLINQTNIQGKLKAKYAIWEVDEAAVKTAISQVQPKIVLFNNLSRDQLDRYGELDAVIHSWQSGINSLPSTSLVFINQLDPRLKNLRAKNLKPFGQTLNSGQFFQANLQAATAIAQVLKINSNKISKAVKDFKPAFGRGEVFTFRKRQIRLTLVKNPSGFNAVLDWLRNQNYLDQPLLLILNDCLADGTDVSWIWDVNLEILQNRSQPIIIAGLRSFDLALRLKYAGVNPNLLQVQPSISHAWNDLIALKGPVANILPTYTAMLELRHFLSRQKIIHPSWQD
ncbi:MAG: MurT ligase domain-containing protein [Candidatus Beckwithbacteria bacterium]